MLRSSFVASAVAAAASAAGAAPSSVGRATDLLSPAQQVADLQLFVDTLLTVGADPFLTSSKSAFLSAAAQLRGARKTPTDVRRFYLAIAPLFSRLNDAHCRVIPSFYYDAIARDEAVVFPLAVTSDGDALIVTQDVSSGGQIPRGSTLVAINGVPAATIRADARELGGGQTEALRAIAVPYGDSIAFRYGGNGRFEVRYRTPDGVEGSQTVALEAPSALQRAVPAAASVPSMSAASAAARAAQIRPPRLPRGPYAYGTIAGDTVGYLAYRACDDPAGMESFAQATFARIAQEKPRALIIDVRYNGGGDSAVNDVLLSYFTGKPYAQVGAMSERISALLKHEYGHAKFAAVYGEAGWNARDGSLLHVAAGPLTHPKAQALRYHGPVYVLMGARTFSSAMMFVLAIKDFGLATLVGEATGEPAIGTGEIAKVTARYSRLSATFTTKLFFPPKPHPPGVGVVPDVIVPTSDADRIAGRDPVLTKTLALIG